MRVAKFGELTQEDIHLGGGKGVKLSEMVRAGFPVPPGFIVSAEAFTEAVMDTGVCEEVSACLDEVDLDCFDSLSKVSDKIKELIRSRPLSPALEEEIIEAYRLLSGGEPCPVAVRSSATMEDLSDASFAGQQETFLYVLGEEKLLKYIRECWASLFNGRAIFYRSQKGFCHKKASIAVVVQKMINSEKSGVLFTKNPITKQEDSMVIEGSWGLGEAIVSGQVTPDCYIIEKGTSEVQVAHVSCKEKMIVPRDNKKGTVKKEVPAEKRKQRLLSEAEINELVTLGKQLEDFFGSPQDIEWGIVDNKVYLLQSRPITTV